METTEAEKSCKTRKCGCFCHKMSGVFWVAIGVIVLLHAFDVLRANLVWIIVGVLAVVSGLQTLFGGLCKCCDKAGAEK